MNEPTQSAARPSELLCCPFCGGKPLVKEYDAYGEQPHTSIECNNSCEVYPYICKATIEEAVVVWNTRALPTPASVPPSEELLTWAESVDAYAERTGSSLRAFRYLAVGPSFGQYGATILEAFAKLRATMDGTAARPASIEVERRPQPNGGSIETSATCPHCGEDTRITGALSQLYYASGGTTPEKGKAPIPADAAGPQKPACDHVPGAGERAELIYGRAWIKWAIEQHPDLGGGNPRPAGYEAVLLAGGILGQRSDPPAPSTHPKSVIGGSAPEQGGGKTENDEKLILAALDFDKWHSLWFENALREECKKVRAERERAGGGE